MKRARSRRPRLPRALIALLALGACCWGALAASAAAVRPAAAAQSPRSMTIDELAGEHVVYAYSGLNPPASLLALVRRGEAAGVILFTSNIASVAQLRRVTRRLQAAAMASPVHRPLLIMTDQEGGEVRRLPGAPALSEKQIGESSNPAAAAGAAGAGAARLLRAAGVNVNLSPVLDVYRSPGDFIDEYARSYSDDPAVVGRAGGAFIRAQQALGVAATAKHFPGLGAAATSQNTDERPVTLDLPAASLRSIDEAPYRAAIAAGVKLVMTSWAIYPALDAHRPAGLSAAVIGGELRRRLGFRGVVITDAIGAGAVARIPLATRSVMAARAGADLILCATPDPRGNSPRVGIAVMRALARAIRAGRIGRAAARADVARVLALRASP